MSTVETSLPVRNAAVPQRPLPAPVNGTPESAVSDPADVSSVTAAPAQASQAAGVQADTAAHSAQTAATVAASLAGPAAVAAQAPPTAPSDVAKTPPQAICDALAKDLGLTPGSPTTPVKIGSDGNLSAEKFVIPAARVKELETKYGLDDKQFLLALIPAARPYANPPISEFHVGAAGMAASGNVYLGVNLEFEGAAINQTVHGEQFVTTNALNHGETSLKYLAVSAEPCGHCRQWLNELNGAKQLQVIVPDAPIEGLADLLRHDFGPQDLGIKGGLMSPQDGHFHMVDAQPGDDQKLDDAALSAANRSYAPYSHSNSGVAIRTVDDSGNEKVYTGAYSENAAFNPSLSPLQGALIAMVADGRSWSTIKDVVLDQVKTDSVDNMTISAGGQTYELPVNGKGVDQALATFAVLRQVNPDAKLAVRHISN